MQKREAQGLDNTSNKPTGMKVGRRGVWRLAHPRLSVVVKVRGGEGREVAPIAQLALQEGEVRPTCSVVVVVVGGCAVGG